MNQDMTMEEKLALIAKSGITVNGDLVLEKHVENEIGNVESGANVQIINGAVAKTSTKRTQKQAPTTKVLPSTFIYKWKNDRDGMLRLIKLYQLLSNTSCGWLDDSTKPDDWCALFMGEPKEFTLKWMGTQQHLYYLFKVLTNKKYISCPKGVGKWIIVGSHFLDKDSRQFDDWNSQQDPVKAKTAIEKLAEVLNLATDLSDY